MEFLLSLLLWIFGADATASQPVVQRMNPSTIEGTTFNNGRLIDSSLQTEGGSFFNGNTRIRHTIVIFEDTHFRQQQQ